MGVFGGDCGSRWICLLGLVCLDLFAWTCLLGLVCLDLFAWTCLLGDVCWGVYLRESGPDPQISLSISAFLSCRGMTPLLHNSDNPRSCAYFITICLFLPLSFLQICFFFLRRTI